MACTTRPDVSDTRSVINLGSHLAHEGLDRVIGSPGATGHHARSLEGTFGTPRHTHADVAKALAFQLSNAAFGIGVEGIATINQQISLLQVGGEGSDGVVNRLTSLHHHQDASRTFELAYELLQRFGTHNLFTRSTTHQEVLGFGIGAVVNSTGKTIPLCIQDEVFAHHTQANQAEMRLTHCGRLVSVCSVWQR